MSFQHLITRHSREPSPSFPRRRETTGRGEGGQQAKTTDQVPSPLMGEESKVRVKTMPQRRPVIADLIRNPEVRGRADNKTKQHRARHTGFKAVSTGRGHTKCHSSTSSLVTPANPHRHSRAGGKPQGGVRGANKPKQPTKSPLP